MIDDTKRGMWLKAYDAYRSIAVAAITMIIGMLLYFCIISHLCTTVVGRTERV